MLVGGGIYSEEVAGHTSLEHRTEMWAGHFFLTLKILNNYRFTGSCKKMYN